MGQKKYNWTNVQEDRLMDLFEDNESLYEPASKDNSNRPKKRHHLYENQPPIQRGKGQGVSTWNVSLVMISLFVGF